MQPPKLRSFVPSFSVILLLIPFSFLVYVNVVTAYGFFLVYEGFRFKKALNSGCV